jgi:hypothetical protein
MPEAPLTPLRLGSSARAVVAGRPDDVPDAVAALGIPRRPVIVLVGGAEEVNPDALRRLRPLFDDALLPVAFQLEAVIVDGGTRSGVMRAAGESRARAGVHVPLVGVAVARTVRLPGVTDPRPDAADLDPHHTHFVLVPGENWGDESPWLAWVAAAVADGLPSVTVVVNGGKITLDDVESSLLAMRPVIVLDGSGRTADDVAAALEDDGSDERLRGLAASGLITAVPADDPARLAHVMAAVLTTSNA